MASLEAVRFQREHPRSLEARVQPHVDGQCVAGQAADWVSAPPTRALGTLAYADP